MGWVVIVSIGAVQSLFLAILLIARRTHASYWLAGVLVALASILAEEAVDLGGLGARLPWILGSTMAFELLLGPLILLFVRNLRSPDRKPRLLDSLYFLPFVAAQCVLVIVNAQRATGAGIEPGSPTGQGTMDWILTCKGPILLIFLIASWRALAGLSEPQVLVRARRAIFAFTGLGIASLAIFHLRRIGFDVPVDSDRFAGLGLTLGLHAVGLLTLWPRLDLKSPTESNRYGTSPLTAEAKIHLEKKLMRHLDSDRPWLASELTLDQLASSSGIPRHHLSQVLNQQLGTTFYELVSRFRVDEACRLLGHSSLNDRTILDLAFDAGFNSKASFQRTFRQVTGTTPSKFRAQQQDHSSPSTE